MTKPENIILWKNRFADRKASGLKVNDWCEKNKVSRHAYYYWYRNVQATLQASSETVFIEIPAMSSQKNPVSKNEGVAIAWKDFTFQIFSLQDVPVMADLIQRLVKEC